MKLNTRFAALTTAALTIAAFTFTACRKDATAGEDTGYGADHATLEKTNSDVISIADQAGTTGSLSNFKTGPTILSGCAIITRDTTSVPHILTINFGTTNCVCGDGVSRRGKIIVTYTGRYSDANSVHTITFSNYFHNDNQVTGSKTVTNTGLNAAGQPAYNISVNDSIILANGNGTISWTSQRMRTWTNGYNTPQWQDDEYDITGSGTVTRANGKTFQINITTPLHIALNCHWVESGVVQIVPQNTNARTLDYGNGACDQQAVYTANGHNYNITLRN